jgi:hypothetical protein
VAPHRAGGPLHGGQEQFEEAGVALQAYNLSFNDSFTDLEIEKGFDQAKALGVKLITASSNLKTVPRLVPFAEKYKMTVAMHNHRNIEGPERVRDAGELRRGAGPVEALRHQPRHRPLRRRRLRPDRLHHQATTTDHQPAHQGSQEGSGRQRPVGQGDTPIKDVLQLVKKNKYDIPVNIEYEYRGDDPVAEVRKCLRVRQGRARIAETATTPEWPQLQSPDSGEVGSPLRRRQLTTPERLAHRRRRQLTTPETSANHSGDVSEHSGVVRLGRARSCRGRRVTARG